MAKKIIISADDFGRNPYRNQAIDEAFSKGFIKCAALIVNSPYSIEAINLAIRGGYIKHIHCHFNFTGGLYTDYNAISQSMRENSEWTDGKKFRVQKQLPYGEIDTIDSVKMVGIFYDELVAQYELFMKLTDGKANCNHVDFHCYYNLSWPIALALRDFSIRYQIKTVRIIGCHQETNPIMQILAHLGLANGVKAYRSCNIDFYLCNLESLKNEEIMELYVHPDYYKSPLMDNSVSYFGHPKRLLETQISDLLQKAKDIEFVSWAEV